jgi:CheY-like chemotaxis protein
VLLVDDFPINLLVAEGLLAPYRMCVFTCLNGREAVELVQARSFDLVFMDHMMPEMDGMEAVAIIRGLGGRFAELPIVAFTANVVSGMGNIFLENGFNDVLAKPVETDKLDAVLRKWIPAAKQQTATADDPIALKDEASFSAANSLPEHAGCRSGEVETTLCTGWKMMEYGDRIEEFTRDGKNFLYVDVSNFKSNADVLKMVDVVQRCIGTYPAKSVYTIVNIENIMFDTETKEMAGRCLRHNEPYVKYGAVIGLDGIKKIMVNAIVKLSGRDNMQFFRTREQALEWLLRQA